MKRTFLLFALVIAPIFLTIQGCDTMPTAPRGTEAPSSKPTIRPVPGQNDRANTNSRGPGGLLLHFIAATFFPSGVVGVGKPDLPWDVIIEPTSSDSTSSKWKLEVKPDGEMPLQWEAIIEATPTYASEDEQTVQELHSTQTRRWQAIGQTTIDLPGLMEIENAHYQVTILFKKNGNMISVVREFDYHK